MKPTKSVRMRPRNSPTFHEHKEVKKPISSMGLRLLRPDMKPKKK